MTMRSAKSATVACALALAACGPSNSTSSGNTGSGTGPLSEFTGTWQAGGTFPGDCTDLECPAQFSFQLELRSSGACVLKGQTRKYRTDVTTAGWDYEDWHPYTQAQGSCQWTSRDGWHMKMVLQHAHDTWTGALNGSVLEVTSPQLQNLRIRFSRVDQ
jgi:hypothetical protein